MFLENTQCCNTVELHAVQCTSTRFVTIAYFSSKGHNSVHKSLQSVVFFNHICNYARNYLHSFAFLTLRALWTLLFYNKVHKVQANNKVQKVRTSHLCCIQCLSKRAYLVCKVEAVRMTLRVYTLTLISFRLFADRRRFDSHYQTRRNSTFSASVWAATLPLPFL